MAMIENPIEDAQNGDNAGQQQGEVIPSILPVLPVQRGNVHEVRVDPGEILRSALAMKASGIILVHNHPGGKARPSGADVALTDELRLLAPKLGLRFLDHVIVSDGECFSMGMNTTV